MILGDAATWVGAGVAGLAAIFTWQQASMAKKQRADALGAAKEDDEQRRKRIAIELAQEWCRTETPSAIGILRDALISCDRDAMEALIAGEPLTLSAEYEQALKTFFTQVLVGHFQPEKLKRCPNVTIQVDQGYAHIIWSYFARRVNFYEMVIAALNTGLADRTLIDQFFGRLLHTNPSYKTAVDLNRAGWPELAKFYKLA